jgi:uncharacterized protein (DUF2147 family)
MGMKRFALAAIAAAGMLFSADDIAGFWKTISDETGKPQCVIAVYEYDGLYYGRIIGTYNDEGKMTDSIYKPDKRAPGVVGNPFYSGLDIIWDLQDAGNKFKGKILDPEKGNVYNSELWIDNGNLIVRGKLLIFGRSQEWLPAAKSDFPRGFKMPNLNKLVPSVPEVK